MHVTRSYLDTTPGRAEQKTYEIYEKGILDWDFRSVTTFFCRVHHRHSCMRHPDTRPKRGMMIWLNEEYSALSGVAEEEYRRRYEQVKQNRMQNISDTDLDGLIVWLKTKIDICSDRCEDDSTNTLRQYDTSA